MRGRWWVLWVALAGSFSACAGEEFSSGSGGNGGASASAGSGPCAAGEKQCDTACVSTELPAYGCGASTCEPCNVLNASAQCVAGSCAVKICVGSFADCDNRSDNGCEINLNSSADCGVCGNACPSGQVCLSGQCAAGCGALTECNGGCVDILSDLAHCGACDKPCQTPSGGEQASCVNGVCQLSCADDYANCETSAPDCETSIKTDPGNCGGCGLACPDAPPGAPAVGCMNGSCGCPDGLTVCGDGTLAACVDTSEEPAACGSCSPCGFGEHCHNSACQPAPSCAFGLTSCNSACVSLDSDPKNCGSCGKTCSTGDVCKQGQCQLPTTCLDPYMACPITVEPTACFHKLFDAANCGACGNACTTGQACLGGVCVGLILSNEAWICGTVNKKACSPDPDWPIKPEATYFCHSSCPWGPPG